MWVAIRQCYSNFGNKTTHLTTVTNTTRKLDLLYKTRSNPCKGFSALHPVQLISCLSQIQCSCGNTDEQVEIFEHQSTGNSMSQR